MRKPRLVYVVTHPVTADVLLRGQVAFMREHGFDVTVIGSPGPELDSVREREQITTVPVPMARPIDMKRDAKSLMHLTAVLRRLKPDIVNAGTTKAGLLGMMAARATSVPIRIYLLRGLRLETATGLTRSVLGVTEKIAAACAHDVACVSPSVLRLSVDGGYIPAEKALVIGAGSSNGVDSERYHRSDVLRNEGQAQLQRFGINADDRVVGFVGRLAHDKGIRELLDGWARVRAELPNAKLVMIGGDLGDEAADQSLVELVRNAPGVVATGAVKNLAPWYARMDLLAFPSFREGFPNVVAEAACAETPVVAFRSTGVVDAVVSGETGALVAQGDTHALAHAILEYLKAPTKLADHGRAARARTINLFERRKVWNAWLDAYRERLAANQLPLPIA